MAPTGMQRKNKSWPGGEEQAEVKGLNEGREHSSGGLLLRGGDADRRQTEVFLQILHNVL